MPQADLDTRLLNPELETAAAGRLREERNSPLTRMALDQADSGGQRQRIGETGSFGDWASEVRQATNIKRQAERLKEKYKGKIEQAVAAPIKQGTSELLKQAWINLIDSFGLTLIWINIHVFLRWSVGDALFCKLGEEWLPKQAQAAGGEAAKTASRGFGWLEAAVLIGLDLIVGAVIFGILAIIVMIIDFMLASIPEKIEMFFGALTGLGWGSIKAFYNLFKGLGSAAP